MSVTIKDVARLAGCSITTVSRVMHHADNVNPDIRARVEQAIQKLDYSPNKAAQGLGGMTLNSIGIISTHSSGSAFSTPYFSEVLQSIGCIAEEREYDLLLNTTSNSYQEYERCMTMVRSNLVRGIILLSSRVNTILLEKLASLSFPFVLIGNVEYENLKERIHIVDTDNFNDCKAAVSHLIDLGHTRIACLHSSLDYVVNQHRLNGFLAAHTERDIPIRHTFIHDCGSSAEDARLFTRELMQRPNAPTAIFATDDTKAVGAYRALHELGLRVPEDVSVIGHNNYEISAFMQPPLTTVHVPIADLGVTATRILFDLIDGRDAPLETLLPTRLILRESCCPPRQEG